MNRVVLYGWKWIRGGGGGPPPPPLVIPEFSGIGSTVETFTATATEREYTGKPENDPAFIGASHQVH